MFHSGARRLIQIWAALPGASETPFRRDFDPSLLGDLLPHAFVVSGGGEGLQFRLAGGWVERLRGRSLKDVSFADLWTPASRALVWRSALQAFEEARPMMILAETDPVGAPLEIALAPLRGPRGAPDRLVGLCVPTTSVGRGLAGGFACAARLAAPVNRPPSGLDHARGHDRARRAG